MRLATIGFLLAFRLCAQEPGSALPLAPHDEVTLQAFGAPEMDGRTYSVDDRGVLRLPLAGQIAASGLTPREVEVRIESGLRRYVRDPKVLVVSVRYAARPVSVLGAVRNPGVIQISKPTRLLEALSAVGGLRPDAGPIAAIARNGAGEPRGRDTIRVPLEPLLRGEAGHIDPLLSPHDVVVVPRANQVYVIGAVRNPGAFTAEAEGRLSVLRLLSLAGGLAGYASPGRARVLTQTPGAAWEGEPVDLKSMIAGQTPDRELKPEEILFIPSSGGKAAAAHIGRAVLTFGTGAAIWSAAR